MAKPRVFISSTFYDLRQIRTDIDQFIKSIGYEPIRNESGNIAYGKENPLEDYCMQEIESSDILISIIGGRFGSESKDLSKEQQLERKSISQRELKTALERNKQVYIFIDKNVSAEFETYRINKDVENINYRYVDDKRIYGFIEEIKDLVINNNIKEFETSEDIISYLREQFAGLFQRFLDNQIRIKEFNLISELDRTSQVLNKLVEFLSEQNKDQQKGVDQILMLNHPLISKLKDSLNIPYNFYIVGYEDLFHLLQARGFKKKTVSVDENEDDYTWIKNYKDGSSDSVYIDKKIFDKEQNLINILPAKWKEDYFEFVHYEPPIPTDDNELPF